MRKAHKESGGVVSRDATLGCRSKDAGVLVR